MKKIFTFNVSCAPYSKFCPFLLHLNFGALFDFSFKFESTCATQYTLYLVSVSSVRFVCNQEFTRGQSMARISRGVYLGTYPTKVIGYHYIVMNQIFNCLNAKDRHYCIYWLFYFLVHMLFYNGLLFNIRSLVV